MARLLRTHSKLKHTRKSIIHAATRNESKQKKRFDYFKHDVNFSPIALQPLSQYLFGTWFRTHSFTSSTLIEHGIMRKKIAATTTHGLTFDYKLLLCLDSFFSFAPSNNFGAVVNNFSLFIFFLLFLAYNFLSFAFIRFHFACGCAVYSSCSLLFLFIRVSIILA